MNVEYAPRGLVGVLTPQANTTVEPEFSLLWPAGVAMLNARLMSEQTTLEARLVAYFNQLDQAVLQFANAPLGVIALACTGASYLAGADAERATIARIEAARATPFLTAGRAVQKALDVLGAKRIALVSPYPPSLTETSVGYWNALGFDVVTAVHVGAEGENFHPIYSIRASGAADALVQLEGGGFDAIVMLGTGMPTLQPILERPSVAGAPVMSCMLCLGWAAAHVAMKREATRDTLLEWISGAHWRKRLYEHQGLAA